MMSELHAKAWLMEFTLLKGKDDEAAAKKLMEVNPDDLRMIFTVLFVSYIQLFKKDKDAEIRDQES